MASSRAVPNLRRGGDKAASGSGCPSCRNGIHDGCFRVTDASSYHCACYDADPAKHAVVKWD